MEDTQSFQEKAEVFVETHERIVEDFERSLANAKHFLELSRLSMDAEPENTVDMLEQIKDIDLLGHLSTQFEEFQQTAGFLDPPASKLENQEVGRKVEALRQRYENLVAEAEGQMESLDEMLNTLQVTH